MSGRAKPGAEALAAAAGAAMYGRDHAAKALGIALAEIGPGRARTTMTVGPAMVNGHGTCHGGLIFTLADTAFAYACNSRNQASVAQHCSITFLKPARRDDRLTADAVEQTLDGRSGVYDVRVANQKGEAVALFRGHSRTIPGEVARSPASKEPT